VTNCHCRGWDLINTQAALGVLYYNTESNPEIRLPCDMQPLALSAAAIKTQCIGYNL
jgi:hypothetical protein